MAVVLQDLDESQKKSYEKFLRLASDFIEPHHKEHYLLKWLNETKFDSKKAADMFTKSMKWRKKHGIDDILDTWYMPEPYDRLADREPVGFDKTGHPVYILASGGYDIRAIISSIPMEDILLTVSYIWAISKKTQEQQSEKLGRLITKRTLIVDFDGVDYSLAMWRPVWKLAIQVCDLVNSNYPDDIKTIICINCASFITAVYHILKYVVNESIVKMVRIYGTDKSTWMAALLEEIDASELPKHWGGTAVDPDGDPRCPSRVCVKLEIPKEILKNDPIILAQKGLKKATVDVSSIFQFNIEVREVGATLRWVFYSDGQDIIFKIHRHGSTGLVEIINQDRVKCFFSLVEGETGPLEPGKYVVTFDNSYYKLKAKNVSYSVKVV